MTKVNIGCGLTPTQGWINYDNSFSIKLSKFQLLSSLLHKLKVINSAQMDLIRFCKDNNIIWADVTKNIPLRNNSVDILYSSHMLEHLDRDEANIFLQEAKRVLKSNGIIRLAIPDMEKIIKRYLETADADLCVESMHMCVPRPRSLAQRMKILLVGPRHHQWMYDGKSLSKLITNSGFKNPIILNPGDTNIRESAPLDLYERADESVYLEAFKP